MPGRPIGPWSRRTGAGGVRDRTGPEPNVHELAQRDGTGRAFEHSLMPEQAEQLATYLKVAARAHRYVMIRPDPV